LSGRARKRPDKLRADRAYASRADRAWLRRPGIAPRIVHYGVKSRERLGRWPWIVEPTLGWLHRVRRLRIGYERRTDIHQAFLSLACTHLLAIHKEILLGVLKARPARKRRICTTKRQSNAMQQVS
jgi:hypothetical protein